MNKSFVFFSQCSVLHQPVAQAQETGSEGTVATSVTETDTSTTSEPGTTEPETTGPETTGPEATSPTGYYLLTCR